MIGDEPGWLVNLIITVSVLPLIVGSVGEHAGTRTLLLVILALFLLVGLYTLFSGQIVKRPGPRMSGDRPVPRRSNPFAIHSEDQLSAEPADDAEEEEAGPPEQ